MRAQFPQIDAARCSGCGRCIGACELRLFAFERQGWRKVAVLQDESRCIGCGECADRCVVGALNMRSARDANRPSDNAGSSAAGVPACL